MTISSTLYVLCAVCFAVLHRSLLVLLMLSGVWVVVWYVVVCGVVLRVVAVLISQALISVFGMYQVIPSKSRQKPLRTASIKPFRTLLHAAFQHTLIPCAVLCFDLLSVGVCSINITMSSTLVKECLNGLLFSCDVMVYVSGLTKV